MIIWTINLQSMSFVTHDTCDNDKFVIPSAKHVMESFWQTQPLYNYDDDDVTRPLVVKIEPCFVTENMVYKYADPHGGDVPLDDKNTKFGIPLEDNNLMLIHRVIAQLDVKKIFKDHVPQRILHHKEQPTLVNKGYMNPKFYYDREGNFATSVFVRKYPGGPRQRQLVTNSDEFKCLLTHKPQVQGLVWFEKVWINREYAGISIRWIQIEITHTDKPVDTTIGDRYVEYVLDKNAVVLGDENPDNDVPIVPMAHVDNDDDLTTV